MLSNEQSGHAAIHGAALIMTSNTVSFDCLLPPPSVYQDAEREPDREFQRRLDMIL